MKKAYILIGIAVFVCLILAAAIVTVCLKHSKNNAQANRKDMGFDLSIPALGEKDFILIGGDTLVIFEHLFDKDALIFEGVQSKSVTLDCEESRTKVHFTFGGVPFLATWAKPNAPFVCIEPRHGINDSYEKVEDFSKKRGIETLPAGESFSFSWSSEMEEA